MSIKYAVLGVLAERPLHGYALRTAFEKRLGDLWELSYGQVYQILTSLERDGFITASWQKIGNRPRRKVFAITAAGREALRTWLIGAPAQPARVRDELYLRLLLAHGSDASLAVALIDGHAASLRGQLADLLREREGRKRGKTYDDLIDALCVEAAILEIEARMSALDRSRTTLARLESGVSAAVLIDEVSRGKGKETRGHR
jgi:DNA-binding PadR family transcriptional regulator